MRCRRQDGQAGRGGRDAGAAEHRGGVPDAGALPGPRRSRELQGRHPGGVRTSRQVSERRLSMSKRRNRRLDRSRKRRIFFVWFFLALGY